MSIYNTRNEDALATQGYKPYKDSTLKSMSKDDLIDQIRCLEHNWAGEIKANKLLSYRLKCFLDVLEKNGHPEKFNQICALPGEYGYRQDDLEPNNVKENMKIDREEEYKKFFGMWDLDEMNYFTEEEQKAEAEVIKKMAVESKENFYDYYVEKERKND